MVIYLLYLTAFLLQRQTVRFWISRGKDNLTDKSRRARRPRKVDREFLRREYEKESYTLTKSIAELFKVTTETIRQHLHHMGLDETEQYAKKAGLTNNEKIARMNFAQKYLNFNWNHTIFCGARTFKYYEDGSLYLSPYNQEELFTIPSNAVNIWGWMTADGVGELCSLPPQTSKMDYIDVLQNVMLPTVRNVYPEDEVPRINVVLDNSLQKEKVIHDWFRSHPEIKRIPWPSKSSDLNPIEILWGLMVHGWYIGTQRTRTALEQHCNMMWEEMRGIDICEEIVGSMRDLLQAVIEAEGDYVQYSFAFS